MKIKKSYLEYVFLIVFFSTFLLLGLSNMWDKQLRHDFPYAYLASDSFLHQANSEFIKEQGTVKYSPMYLGGGYEEIFNPHPFVLVEMASVLSYFTGLETYDTIYFMSVLILFSGILVIYLIIRKFNTNVALLSLPVTLLVFSKLFNLGLWWGLWHFMVGVPFMIAVVWCFDRIKLKSMFWIMGIFFAATISEHIPEAVFITGFFIIYILIDYFREKKLNLERIKRVFYAGLIGILLSIFYIVVFMNTFFVSEGFRGTPAKGNFGFPDIFIQNLGYLGIVFLIGAVLFFLFMRKGDNILPAVFSIYMLLVSYLTYLGFGKRAFTHRFFWHAYLAFFFGVAIYYVVKIFIKKWDTRHSFALAIVILVFFAYLLNPQTKVGQGIMDKETWDALKWIEKNTEEDAKVYYFVYPGDGLSQAAAIYNSHRVGFKIGYREVASSLEQGAINRTYGFGLSDAWETLLCKRAAFSFGSYKNALKTEGDVCEKGIFSPKKPESRTDLCNIEYYYFNKFTPEEGFRQFNLVLEQTLLKNDWIKEVYSNQMVSILKNEKPGVECLGQ